MKLFFTIIFFLIAFSSLAKKPNILIVSIDSFNVNKNYPNNFDPLIMPNLEKLANNSYVYKNSFTQNPWANISLWISRIPIKIFSNSEYQFIGNDWQAAMFRKMELGNNFEIPPKFYIFIPSDEQSFNHEMINTRDRILATKKDHKPFFLQLHFKELHPPLYIKAKIQLAKLSTKSQTLLNEYINLPQKHPEKVVLYSILFDEMLRLHHSTQVLRALNKLVGQKKIPRELLRLQYINLTIMQDLLDIWKNSNGYKEDLELLKEIYIQRESYLDHAIADLLNLYGDTELQQSTTIIILSNFGLALMEHDQIFNSVNIYDEFISTHSIIHLPKQQVRTEISNQITLRGISSFISKMLSLDSSRSNFLKEQADTMETDHFLASNYNHDLLAIRQKNKWKLIIDTINLKRELYNLEIDPNEKHNCINESPEKSAELEKLIIDEIANE